MFSTKLKRKHRKQSHLISKKINLLDPTLLGVGMPKISPRKTLDIKLGTVLNIKRSQPSLRAFPASKSAHLFPSL